MAGTGKRPDFWAHIGAAVVLSGLIAIFQFSYMWIGYKDSGPDDLMPDNWKEQALRFDLTTLAVTLVAGIFTYLLRRAAWREEERRSQHAAQAAEDKRAREAQQADDRRRTEERERRLAHLRGLPEATSEAYAAAIGHLEAATRHMESARQHRQTSAYSPFWEDVEAGVNELGMHQVVVDRISGLVDEQNTLCAELEVTPHSETGAMMLLPDTATGEAAIVAFRELVLDAQRDFQFASIYEQRRTTAAVVAGFANLGAAVNGLSVRIETGYRSMASAIKRQTEMMEGRAVEHARRGSVIDEYLSPLAMSHTFGGQILEVNRNLERISRQL